MMARSLLLFAVVFTSSAAAAVDSPKDSPVCDATCQECIPFCLCFDTCEKFPGAESPTSETCPNEATQTWWGQFGGANLVRPSEANLVRPIWLPIL